jgi:hypothetical protein
MNVNKFDKSQKIRIMIILAMISIAAIVVVLLFRWIRYWLYYKPLYAIFGGNLYFPFYLYLAVFVILGTFFLVVSLTLKYKLAPKIMISSVLVIVILLWCGFHYKDFVSIKNNEFMTVQCDLSHLRVYQTDVKPLRSFSHYQIRGLEKVDGKYLYINMDYYQYHELLTERNENKIERITVYYLAHSRRMLKYEY